MKIIITSFFCFINLLLLSQDISRIEGKLVVGGTTSQASLINVNGTTPSMLRLQGTGSNGAYQQFYSNNAYWGLIGDEDGDGSDLYFDIKSRSGAAGIAMSTGLTTNALLIENNGKADFSKSIEVGDEPSGASPTPGTIRWNGTDFEGYDGSNWKSLTKSSNTIASGETVTDIDGNVYKTVKIGTQTWMKENLKVTRYNDGTIIPEVSQPEEWSLLTNGAWSWYDNDCQYDNVIGKLYNWPAVENNNICPLGWHVPTESELQYVIDQNTSPSGQGQVFIMSNGYPAELNSTISWIGNNHTGFTARPSGYRSNTGMHRGKGEVSAFWTVDNISTSDATALWINSSSATFFPNGKIRGLSIRCLKD